MTEISLKFLEDDFEVLEKLGKGGMGQVFKARQKSLDRLVAIKILPLDLCRNEEFIGRFKREARLAGKFYHPNAIQVFDIGEHNGQYYYIMEYVEGGSLKEKLTNEGKLNQIYVLNVLKQILSVLKEAEAMKIIHRDIKPDNIMLGLDGIIKLADLGLAREVNDDAGLTQQKIAIGTPHYMAPEQAQGKPVDMRADQYALGVTAYHLLTGHPPFTGKNNMEVLVQHVKKPMPKPSVSVPSISPYMDKLILKMTEKEPKNRFQSIDEILKAVAKVTEAIAESKEAKNSTNTPKLKSERSIVLERRREKNSFASLFIFLALILVLALVYFFVDFTAYTNPYQSIRENALYKVSLMEKEKRYEDCLAELKEALKKIPSHEQDQILIKKNQIEVLLVNDAIEKVMVVSNDSVENCERGIKELDKILDRFGKNALAAKPKREALLERIAQIKAEEQRILEAEREKNKDEKVNKLSLDINALTVDKKFKAAMELVKKFSASNPDAGVKVSLLADNILELEEEYAGEILAKAEGMIKAHEYDNALKTVNEVFGNFYSQEFIEKLEEHINKIPKLKAANERERAHAIQAAYQQTRDSIYVLLKIAEIKAAKIKLEELKEKKLTKEQYAFLSKVVDSYSYIYKRIEDGLLNEFKDILKIDRVGKNNIEAFITSIKGGVIKYTFAGTKLSIEPLNEGWASTYTTIAEKVTRTAQAERILQICIFAYVNGDLEGAQRLALEAEKLGLDKENQKQFTKVIKDEFLDWLDIQFDGMVEEVKGLLAKNNKTRAKLILDNFTKRYGETLIYQERIDEIKELKEKIGE